jgi:hypothetical protein
MLSEKENARKILKYVVKLDEIKDVTFVPMPRGARVLKVVNQHNRLTFYADCDEKQGTAKHKFRIAGTGHPLGVMSPNARYVNTVLFDGGSLVLHVYDLGEV